MTAIYLDPWHVVALVGVLASVAVGLARYTVLVRRRDAALNAAADERCRKLDLLDSELRRREAQATKR